jgi:18S rRNA (guanine1575-N7)-methyltransferase
LNLDQICAHGKARNGRQQQNTKHKTQNTHHTQHITQHIIILAAPLRIINETVQVQSLLNLSSYLLSQQPLHNVMSSRPEGSQAPDQFYDEREASKYNASSRMVNIQAEISNRAIEMLNLPQDRPSYILDIGCGSGMSGEALEAAGHYWCGMDISKSMLDVANDKDNDMGDLIHQDMGLGLPFRPGSFDGIISVSAIQWLCYSDSNSQDPKLRLNRFFSSLYTILKRDAKAILQFYPESPEQAVLVMQCASKVGFAGGLVVDYPNSAKAKKYYLCLSFERTYQVPAALGENSAASGVTSVARATGRWALDSFTTHFMYK